MSQNEGRVRERFGRSRSGEAQRPPWSRSRLDRRGGRGRSGRKPDRWGQRPIVRCRRQRLPGIRVRGPSGDARLPRHPRDDHPHRSRERRSRVTWPAGSASAARVRARTARRCGSRSASRRSRTRRRWSMPRSRVAGRIPSSSRSSRTSRSVRATRSPSSRCRAGRTGGGCGSTASRPRIPCCSRTRRTAGARSRPASRGTAAARSATRSPSASTVSASPRRPGARGARSPPASSSRIAASASSA